jgi:hypothetical protein
MVEKCIFAVNYDTYIKALIQYNMFEKLVPYKIKRSAFFWSADLFKNKFFVCLFRIRFYIWKIGCQAFVKYYSDDDTTI